MIKHIPEKQQFELNTEAGLALVSYHKEGDIFVLWHSEVPYNLRGQGVGKKLVESTFDYLVKNDIKAKATCSYIRMIAMRGKKWDSHITY